MLRELFKMLRELFKMLKEDLFFPWAMLNAASPLFYPRQTDSSKLRCVCPETNNKIPSNSRVSIRPSPSYIKEEHLFVTPSLSAEKKYEK